MKIVDLPLNQLEEAIWSPNEMSGAMYEKLKASVTIFGVAENLIVRPVGRDRYELLSGHHRLRVLRGLG